VSGREEGGRRWFFHGLAGKEEGEEKC
jgi:hypothetical protein